MNKEKLISLADSLDAKGLKAEADLVDDVVVELTAVELYTEAKKKSCRHMNSDGTFKGGFDGCVSHMKSQCGGNKSDEAAHKICGYINRKKNG